jgi:hypothetical protein
MRRSQIAFEQLSDDWSSDFATTLAGSRGFCSPARVTGLAKSMLYRIILPYER